MKIERLRPTVLRITMHVYETAALMSAARWIADGARGDVPDGMREHLQELVASYDDAMERAGRSG